MATPGEKQVYQKLEIFVKDFVLEYEAQLAFYHLVLRGQIRKAGKFSDTFSGKIGQGVGGMIGLILGSAIGMPGSGASSGSSAGEAVSRVLGEKLGAKQHAKKVKHVVELVKFSRDSKLEFRKMLVEAAVDIFQSFEKQFCHVTSELSVEHALTLLAQDAVNRSIKFYSNAFGESIESSKISIAESVLRGESKIEPMFSVPIPTNVIKSPGYDIKYEYNSVCESWKTASLYEKVGIIMPSDKNGYFIRIDSSSKSEKYGHRRLLTSEVWNDMKSLFHLDNNCLKPPKDYQYNIGVIDVKMIIEKLLENINQHDPTLSEDRIKNTVAHCKNSIMDEIRTLNEMSKQDIKNDISSYLLTLKNSFDEISIELYANLLKQHLAETSTQFKEIAKVAKNVCDDVALIKGVTAESSEDVKAIKNITKETSDEVKDIKNIVKLLSNKPPNRETSFMFNVMPPVKSYSGREKEVLEVHEVLQEYRGEYVISHIASICGLGGIGKSELARKYISEYKTDYDNNVIWINSESEEALKRSFGDACKEIGLLNSDKDDIMVLSKRIYMFFGHAKCLFIFDNVESLESIRQYMPSAYRLPGKIQKPYVLITSRDSEWDVGEEGVISVVTLSTFSPEEALYFVKTSLGIDTKQDDQNIQDLVKELEYFPLALAQAIAYIREKGKKFGRRGLYYTVEDYIKEMKQEKVKLFQFPPSCSGDRYKETAFRTWKITLKRIKREESCGKMAIDVFYRMAYLESHNMYLLALSKCYNGQQELFWDAIELLSRYSMIVTNGGLASIHALVQEVTRLRLNHKKKEEQILDTILQSMIENVSVSIELNFREDTRMFSGVSFATINEAYRNIFIRFFESEKYDLNDILEAFDVSCNKILRKGSMIFRDLLISEIEYYLVRKKDKSELYAPRSKVIESLFNLRRVLQEGNRQIIAVWKYAVEHECLVEKFIFRCFGTLMSTYLNIYIMQGDSDTMKKFLNIVEEKHPDMLIPFLNTSDIRGNSPIHIAALRNELDVAKYIIKLRSDLNMANINGDTPLHIAVSKNDWKFVSLLIDNGANLSNENLRKDTPLHLAAQFNNFAITKALIDKGSDLNVENCDGNSPLHIAAAYADRKIVKLFLDKGNNINKSNSHGHTPLKHAVKFNNVETVKTLIEMGADLGTVDKLGNSPLHLAAKYGHHRIVKLFVENEVDVNKANFSQDTPLHLAVRFGDLATVEFLVENGADLNSRDSYGGPPLHVAAGLQDLEILKYLIEIGSSVEWVNSRGNSPLHLAAAHSSAEVVKYLLDNGADVNQINVFNETCLHRAAADNGVEVVKLLVENSADLRKRNCNGDTVLHVAAARNKMESVRYLVECGADVNSVNFYGDTPLDIAASKNNAHILKYLTEKCAKNMFR